MGNFCSATKVDEENDRDRSRRCSKSRRGERRRAKSRHRRSSDPNVSAINGDKRKKQKKRKFRNRKNSRSVNAAQIAKGEYVSEGEWRIRSFSEDSVGSEVYFDAEEDLSDTGSDFYSDSEIEEEYHFEIEKGCMPTLFEQQRFFFSFWGGNQDAKANPNSWSFNGMVSGIFRSIWPEEVPAEPVQEEPHRKVSSSQWGSRMRSLTRESFRQLDAIKTPVGIAKINRPGIKYELAMERRVEVERNCWDQPNLEKFLLRSKNYMKNKKKIFAGGQPVYKLVTMDIYSSANSVDHIAERLKLPNTENIPDDCPISPLLVINWQVPMYQAKLFGGRMDGPGLSVVCIYKLDDHFDAKKEVEKGNVFPQTLDLLKRFCEDAVEVDGTPSRERFKMIPNVPNIHEWCNSGCFGKAEQKLLMKYHQKPMLAKPQVAYYAGAEYIEVDLNIHHYNYITRRYFHALRGTLQEGVMDMALVMEGRKNEELPEQVLAAVRLQKLDFMVDYPMVPPIPVENGNPS